MVAARSYSTDAIFVPATIESVTEHWTPHLLRTINGSHSLKVARFKGEFVWHAHPDTDELFYVLSGALVIDIEVDEAGAFTLPRGDEEVRTKVVALAEGDMFVVPRAVRHRPRAMEEAVVMLVEKIGTVNTGDEPGGPRTKKAVLAEEES